MRRFNHSYRDDELNYMAMQKAEQRLEDHIHYRHPRLINRAGDERGDPDCEECRELRLKRSETGKQYHSTYEARRKAENAAADARRDARWDAFGKSRFGDAVQKTAGCLLILGVLGGILWVAWKIASRIFTAIF